ncbi:MAG: alpha/beta fold hydrolase [Myxococcales bacterium]|nr:alpha/beta fold hydrolase [Myxococcales bacterium]
MPFITRDGAKIAYDVLGNEGPWLLLGHSLLCGRFMWDGVLPALLADYRVINVEVRGHGASTAPEAFALEDLAEDWLAILDAEGVDQVSLVGLSMGGMTAMRFALRHPERVRSMVLLDTSADVETRVNRLKYKGLSTVYRRLGFTDVLAKQVTPIMFGKDTLKSRPDLTRALIEHLREHDRPQLIRAIMAVNDRGPLSGLESLRVPTRVLVGEQDVATPPMRSEAVARRIPGATLGRLAHAGHLSAMEVPDRVAEELRAFLSEHT